MQPLLAGLKTYPRIRSYRACTVSSTHSGDGMPSCCVFSRMRPCRYPAVAQLHSIISQSKAYAAHNSFLGVCLRYKHFRKRRYRQQDSLSRVSDALFFIEHYSHQVFGEARTSRLHISGKGETQLRVFAKRTGPIPMTIC